MNIAVAPPLAPRRDRVAEFAAALTVRLAGLPTDAMRREELSRLQRIWIAKYALWADAVDSGQYDPPPGSPDAFDYVLTIAEISARLGRLTSAEVS